LKSENTKYYYFNIWTVLTLAGISVFSVGGYLLAGHLLFRIGYPLDDAWIHQVYARNLALIGEWSFIAGQSSGGSTAPLWSALLAIGYWLGISPYIWTYGWGILLLWGLSLLSEITVRLNLPVYNSRIPWVGIFLLGEWHMVWAASSGMETLLFTLLIMGIIALLSKPIRNYLVSGILIGLCIWVRPDGITLLGPVLMVLILTEKTPGKLIKAIIKVVFGFGILFAVYCLFNLNISGMPWPNTFYAKQLEYAALQDIPFWKRYLTEASLPLIGSGILLLPGVMFRTLKAVQKRDILTLASMAWFLGFIFLYAWRLPVTYQHGRYIIPAMPIYFIWGMSGTIEFLTLNTQNQRQHIVNSVAKLSIFIVWFWFWFLGAKAYAKDVAFIESEMVTMAQWIALNIPSNSIVAAHDIGALGYFGKHRLIDLAGLLNTEVIPIIRDEIKLASYLDQQRVNYLVTFPSWYPRLTFETSTLYQTSGIFSQSTGGENMVIYRWTGLKDDLSN
jgi:hypothetical protein